MNGYIVQITRANETSYYTGKAGRGYLSEKKEEAFVYDTIVGASAKATLFNKMYHLNFIVSAVN